uniref:Uncharacterized protein n=1 Tax=Anguilla anguilla TaxID=7936 RepID=A0A0E9W4Y0_ANGAN
MQYNCPMKTCSITALPTGVRHLCVT